jgi:hypothetical protein
MRLDPQDVDFPRGSEKNDGNLSRRRTLIIRIGGEQHDHVGPDLGAFRLLRLVRSHLEFFAGRLNSDQRMIDQIEIPRGIFGRSALRCDHHEIPLPAAIDQRGDGILAAAPADGLQEQRGCIRVPGPHHAVVDQVTFRTVAVEIGLQMFRNPLSRGRGSIVSHYFPPLPTTVGQHPAMT